MPTLFIIIPSCRPHWVWKCVQFYLTRMEPHDWEIRTLIASQNHVADPKGQNKQNEMLDLIDRFDPAWLFTFADDTVQHPALFRRLGEVVKSRNSARAVVFDNRRNATTVLPAGPENCKPCFVCGGAVAWRRDFIGNRRFDYANYGSRCDGEFIYARYRESPESFVFVNEPLTKFNSFQWEGVPE